MSFPSKSREKHCAQFLHNPLQNPGPSPHCQRNGHPLPHACSLAHHKYPCHEMFVSICAELLSPCLHFSSCCRNTFTLPISAKAIRFCSRTAASPWLNPKCHGRKSRASQVNIAFARRKAWKSLRPQKLGMEPVPSRTAGSFDGRGMQALKGKCLGALLAAAPLQAATDRPV